MRRAFTRNAALSIYINGVRIALAKCSAESAEYCKWHLSFHFCPMVDCSLVQPLNMSPMDVVESKSRVKDIIRILSRPMVDRSLVQPLNVSPMDVEDS